MNTSSTATRAARKGTNGTASRSIYVIGGFLGSGKTTLLKRLLAHELGRGVRPAVVMNEFGEKNVDSQLLHDHGGKADEVEMRELLNGCVCCDISEDLSKTLEGLLREGRGPIFVETTGLAAIDQVVAAVTAVRGPNSKHPSKAPVTRPRAVTVVDAPRFLDYVRQGPQAEADVRAADFVLLNKADQMGPRARTALERRLRKLNPEARIVSSMFADVDPRQILDVAPRPDPAPSRPPDRRAPVDSRRGYSSVTCEVKGAVVASRLRTLLLRYGHRIGRLKGFIHVQGRRGLHEVQWVPGTLDLRPFPDARGVKPHLIIIGRRINWDRFFEATAACVAGVAGKERA